VSLPAFLALLLAAVPRPAVVPADSTAGLLAPGVSHSLARYRAATVGEVRYELALDVTALDSATGRVRVRFRRTGTGAAILDFRGRRLDRALANGHPVSPGGLRNGHLLVPEGLLVPGENTLDLTFVADIAPTGASIIRSHDPGETESFRP
jgi:hypothetical protein